MNGPWCSLPTAWVACSSSNFFGTANRFPLRSPWKAILKNTRGVYPIATPHIGSDLAKWVSYFPDALGTNVSAEELKPHGSLLRELNEFYRNLVAKKGVNIKTLSFYETKPVFGSTLERFTHGLHTDRRSGTSR